MPSRRGSKGTGRTQSRISQRNARRAKALCERVQREGGLGVRRGRQAEDGDDHKREECAAARLWRRRDLVGARHLALLQQLREQHDAAPEKEKLRRAVVERDGGQHDEDREHAHGLGRSPPEAGGGCSAAVEPATRDEREGVAEEGEEASDGKGVQRHGRGGGVGRRVLVEPEPVDQQRGEERRVQHRWREAREGVEERRGRGGGEGEAGEEGGGGEGGADERSGEREVGEGGAAGRVGAEQRVRAEGAELDRGEEEGRLDGEAVPPRRHRVRRVVREKQRGDGGVDGRRVRRCVEKLDHVAGAGGGGGLGGGERRGDCGGGCPEGGAGGGEDGEGGPGEERQRGSLSGARGCCGEEGGGEGEDDGRRQRDEEELLLVRVLGRARRLGHLERRGVERVAQQEEADRVS
mmetsp:Transcript_48683/g.154239  ORF Transcript_48683/g.154239 Transcript_48683/m.154239 type:complete len:408 (-) Transcript_48683:389-1612(-)